MTSKPVSSAVIIAMLSTSLPAMAQTRPAPVEQPQILPVPGNGGPQVQPPRPGTGGPQIQPPRPGTGGPQIQPPRPGTGGPQIQPPRPVRPEPPTPPYPGGPAIQPPRPGNGYAQTLICESRNNRQQRCRANTENRVALTRRISGNCTQGRSWGYDQRAIWVDRGCRAEFSYGRWSGGGGQYPQPERDKGPSTGLIVGGVVVAAGLIALLASNANKKKQADAAQSAPQPDAPATFPAGPPAALSANLSPLPSAARPAVQTCLTEAARQIGATGGTRLSYDRLVSLEPGNGGWRFGASLTATYPDGDRVLPLYCRATPTKVIQLDFAGS